jgi:hypothetical protein
VVERQSEAADGGLEGSRELCPDLGWRRFSGLPFCLAGPVTGGRKSASISSRDSCVGAAILTFTVLSSWDVLVDALSDAVSLPAPPRNRAAGFVSVGVSTRLITANGTQRVPHSQHPMDWSRSHAQWRHLVHRMRFAAGAVYMRQHLQQVIPMRHMPHEPVSWEHETTCSAWKVAIAMMGVLAPEGWGEGSGGLLRMLPGTGRIPRTAAGFEGEVA